MSPCHNRAAKILADEEDLTSPVAATKWRVSVRTIRRYRERRQSDPAFAKLFGEIYAQATEARAERTSALRTGLEKMRELMMKATDVGELWGVTRPSGFSVSCRSPPRPSGPLPSRRRRRNAGGNACSDV